VAVGTIAASLIYSGGVGTSPTISVPGTLDGSPLTDGAFAKIIPSAPLMHPCLSVLIIIL